MKSVVPDGIISPLTPVGKVDPLRSDVDWESDHHLKITLSIMDIVYTFIGREPTKEKQGVMGWSRAASYYITL